MASVLRITPLIELDPAREVISCGTEGCTNLAQRVCNICNAALCGVNDCRAKWEEHSEKRCVRLATATLIERCRKYAENKAAEYDRAASEEAGEGKKVQTVFTPEQIERFEDPTERAQCREQTIAVLLSHIKYDFQLYKVYRGIRKVLMARGGEAVTDLRKIDEIIKDIQAKFARYRGIIMHLQSNTSNTHCET